MTTPSPTPQRPTNTALAKLFDKHLEAGHEIRYSDDNRLVVWQPNEYGCGYLIFLIVIGFLTVFIVPIILLLLGALSPSGQIITYTVKPNGKIKKKSKAAPKP